MRNLPKHTFLLLASALAISPLAAHSAEAVIPELKAIVPTDNDITPNTDSRQGTIPVPDVVARVFSRFVSRAYNWYSKEDPDCVKNKEDCGLERSSMYGRTYVLKTPTGIQLYIFVMQGLEGLTQYCFALYDPKIRRVTQNPPYLDGRWLDSFFSDKDSKLLERPFISFQQVDGRYMLIAETYAHNGNMYNAVVYRYFSVTSDLSLKPVLNLEARAMWEFGDDDASLGTLVRELKFHSSKSATITTYLIPYKSDGQRQLIGSVDVGAPSEGEAFKVIKRMPVVDSILKGALITTDSDDEDDHFLAQGGTLSNSWTW